MSQGIENQLANVGQVLRNVPAHEQLQPDRSLRGVRRDASPHMAPESREVPHSAQPHRWEFFRTADIFAQESIAYQLPQFADVFASLEGRRRPIDALITERAVGLISYVLPDGKVQSLTPTMQKILNDQKIATVKDFYNQTPEQYQALVTVMGNSSAEFLERMQHYTDNLLIPPQLQAVTLLFGTTDNPLPQYPIPKEEEPRILSTLEDAIKRLRRFTTENTTNVFLSWSGWRDGVVRSIETLRGTEEYPQIGLEGEKKPTSTTRIIQILDTAKAVMSHDKVVASMITLPEKSLGRQAGAVVLGDLPGEGDIPDFKETLNRVAVDPTAHRLVEGILQILLLANFSSFSELARVIPSEVPLISQNDQLQIARIFSDTLGPDPLGVKERRKRQKVWDELELARRIAETDTNKLMPQLAPTDVAKIAKYDIREIVGYGIYHPILLGYPLPPRERPTLGDNPIENIFSIWEQGEQEVRERKLSILDILELPESAYVVKGGGGMRGLGEARLNELKKAILSLLNEKEQDVSIDLEGVHSIGEYLIARENAFFLDPTKPEEEYLAIQQAKNSKNLANAMLQTDIDLEERKRKRYEALLQVAPHGADAERFMRNIAALQVLANRVLRPQQTTFDDSLQAAMRVYEDILREYHNVLATDKYKDAIEYFEEKANAEENESILRSLQAT